MACVAHDTKQHDMHDTTHLPCVTAADVRTGRNNSKRIIIIKQRSDSKLWG